MERSHSWSSAEDWKSSGPKAHQGSNPCLSASILRAAVPKGSCGVFFLTKRIRKKGIFTQKIRPPFGGVMRIANICKENIYGDFFAFVNLLLINFLCEKLFNTLFFFETSLIKKQEFAHLRKNPSLRRAVTAGRLLLR